MARKKHITGATKKPYNFVFPNQPVCNPYSVVARSTQCCTQKPKPWMPELWSKSWTP